CTEPHRPKPSRQPFLCFQRRAAGDVLVGPAKIAGSAQRRGAGAILQHGSVLIRRSPAARELDGLSDLAETPLDEGRLIEAWLEKLSRQLAVDWRHEPLSDRARREAAELMEVKFGSDAWTKHRKR
ncbi:MAG: hypothetical protein ACYTG0_30100, partial [Planctomycetota bacterium]